MTALPELLWRRLPAAAQRLSATIGFALADGAYLRAWPAAALAAPAAALLTGLLLGAVHAGPLYSYSIVVLCVLAGIAGLGAAVGGWALLGFVSTDLLVTDRTPIFGPSYYPVGATVLAGRYAALTMSYVLLGGLLVMVPLVSSAFRVLTAAPFRGQRELGLVAGLLVQIALAGVLSWAWAHSAAFMLRPLWSYSGAIPDINAIQPLQQHAVALGVVAAVAAAVRGAAMLVIGARRLATYAVPGGPALPATTRLVLRLIAAPLHALVLTLLLSGLVDGIAQGALVWLVFTGLFYARLLLVGRIPGYGQVVRAVPLLVRLAACVGLSYVLARTFVAPAALSGTQSFSSMVSVVVLSMVVACLLLPAAPIPRTEEPR
jgi:hypothetical protein